MIGAGISGLACAYLLKKRGCPVVLLEKDSRVGGVIQTVQQDGFLFELGPQSFLETEFLNQLVVELGLQSEVVRADPKATRFVLTGGRLHPLPLSPSALLGTTLLSVGEKWRLFTEVFRATRPPAADESVAAFVRRKFGEQLLENFAAPFVSGVYAGDPEQLSLRSAFPTIFLWENQYGSVLRGAMRSRPPKKGPSPSLSTFRGGMAQLTHVLADSLGDICVRGIRDLSIARTEGRVRGAYEVRYLLGSEGRIVQCDAIVVATPTQAAATLLCGVSASLGRTLSRIKYAPVAVVNTGFKREQVTHSLNGFGFLVTPKEQRQTLGTVWNSSLFPGRAPRGTVSMTTFCGGATNPELRAMSESRLGQIVVRELSGLLGIRGAPISQLVWRHERALPQYELGHAEAVATMESELTRLPGLFLTGNYLRGPSIGACVEEADRTATAVAKYLDA